MFDIYVYTAQYNVWAELLTRNNAQCNSVFVFSPENLDFEPADFTMYPPPPPPPPTTKLPRVG